MLNALKEWWSVVLALTLRDIGTRVRHNKAGLLFAIAEPLLYVFLLSGWYTWLQREQYYGSSILLFLATGFVPFFFFVNISAGVTGIKKKDAEFAVVSQYDIFISHFVIGFVIMVASTIISFSLIYCMGIDNAVPFAPLNAIVAATFILIFALGLGLVNCSVIRYFPIWQQIYRHLSRALMVASGVLRVTIYFPVQVQKVIWWNPILHGIEWFRLGFYPNYPSSGFNRSYLITCAIVILCLGLSVERASRSRVNEVW